MQNGTQIIITNCEPSIHLGTSHPGGRGGEGIEKNWFCQDEFTWSPMRLCNIRLPHSLPPPFPLYWQLVGSQFYTVLSLCILLMTNAPSDCYPWKHVIHPKPTPHPTPLPPKGMKSDCLPLVCVDCVDISVHKYIFIYFFFFFFLMYILNSTVNFFSKFPPLLETSFL